MRHVKTRSIDAFNGHDPRENELLIIIQET